MLIKSFFIFQDYKAVERKEVLIYGRVKPYYCVRLLMLQINLFVIAQLRNDLNKIFCRSSTSNNETEKRKKNMRILNIFDTF